MTKRGGSLPYKKGADFERRTLRVYEDAGWLCVRQPKSQSSFDLIAVHKTIRHLVQCKLAGKISGKEKTELLEVCREHGFSPVLAYKRDGGVVLKYLDEQEEEFKLEELT
jgi:Holliday junction resolvase